MKAAPAAMLVAMLSTAALLPVEARAALTTDEVARLSNELTPVGAERGASKDGTIPAWSGGLTSPPPGWKPDGTLDPFAGDRPLITISAANLAQHGSKLSAGMAALLKSRPQLRMNVYPTRRTAAFPKSVADFIARHAEAAVLDQAGVRNFGDSTVPFPIPKSGEEAIWNHLLRYQGGSFDVEFARAVVVPGSETAIATIRQRAIWDTNLDPRPVERQVYFAQQVVSPALMAGTIRVVHEPVGAIRSDRETWILNVSQKRHRKEPSDAYDSEASAVGGLRVIDQAGAFNGAPDRYDWKLLGKREIYVPYNAYRLGDKSLKLKQLLGANSLNPDFMRYELHRVWVVEGTVKVGMRHLYPKRTFYLDEDSWAVLYEDCYDARGNLWRAAMHPLVQLYDVPTPFYRAHVYHDLSNGGYLVEGLDNESTRAPRYNFRGKASEWTPDAILETAGGR